MTAGLSIKPTSLSPFSNISIRATQPFNARSQRADDQDAVRVDVSSRGVSPQAPRPIKSVHSHHTTKPVDADDALPNSRGLYRANTDGSTTVVFDGVDLKIDKDGNVSGKLHGPKGDAHDVTGTYQNGKLSVDVAGVGQYSGKLALNAGSDNKLADGTAALTNIRRTGESVVPPRPDGAVDGLFRHEDDGSTLAVFDGFHVKINKDGSIEGTLLDPKGEKHSISGSLKDGKFAVTVDGVGSYEGKLDLLAHSNAISDGTARLSELRKVG